MRLTLLAACLAIAATSTAAQAKQLIYFHNDSARAISQIAVFPVVKGKVVDDVLQTVEGPIAPGARIKIDTRLTRCGEVSVWARFADGEEVTVAADLCQYQNIRAFD